MFADQERFVHRSPNGHFRLRGCRQLSGITTTKNQIITKTNRLLLRHYVTAAALLHPRRWFIGLRTDLLLRTKNPDMGIRPDQYPIMYFSDNTQVYGMLSSVDRRADARVAPRPISPNPRLAGNGWPHRPTAFITSLN